MRRRVNGSSGAPASTGSRPSRKLRARGGDRARAIGSTTFFGSVRGLVTLAIVLFALVALLGGALAWLNLSESGRTGAQMRVDILKDQVSAQPDDVDARKELAFAYQQTGSERAALKEYGKVLKRDPKDLASLYNTGLIYKQRGDEKRAEKYLSQVIKLAPTHNLAAQALGELYLEDKAYDRVLDVVEPAATAHPGLADLQYLMGAAYAKSGDAEQARTHLEKALALVPGMFEAQTALSQLEEGR